MRRKRAEFCVMRSENSARRGAIVRSTTWNSGPFIVEDQTP
jgi:hypothetical protein